MGDASRWIWFVSEVQTCRLKLCFQMKTKSLEETLHFHRFYNSCQEFESWMEDKENILNTFNTDGDNLGVVQAKYEVLTSPE